MPKRKKPEAKDDPSGEEIMRKPLPKPFKNIDASHLAKNNKKNKRYQNLKKLIRSENYEKLPPEIPTYTSIEVPPSLFPPQKYCDITGFKANYTDPKTGLQYCASDVYHYIQLCSWDTAQQYLKLRGKTVIS